MGSHPASFCNLHLRSPVACCFVDHTLRAQADLGSLRAEGWAKLRGGGELS